MAQNNFDNNPRPIQAQSRQYNPTVRTTFSPAMYAALMQYTKDSGFSSEQDVIRMFVSALLKKAGYLSGNV